MDLFIKGVPSKQGPNKFATTAETMDAFKKTLTTKSWSDIYEGTNMWRDSSLKELENKYGYAASYLAKELIDGVKVSDI